MDLNSLQFGADNYQLTRAMSMSQTSNILSGLPSTAGSMPFSVDLMNQIQDSQLVTARVIDYYDQRVESTLSEAGFSTDNLGSSESGPSRASQSVDELQNNSATSAQVSAQDQEEVEDIQTIVDEILARNEEVEAGTILDLKA